MKLSILQILSLPAIAASGYYLAGTPHISPLLSVPSPMKATTVETEEATQIAEESSTNTSVEMISKKSKLPQKAEVVKPTEQESEPEIGSNTALAAAENQPFFYTPAFSSDTSKGDIPFSSYSGPRFTDREMQKLQQAQSKSNTQLAIPDAAGVITLRHYDATTKKKFISWQLMSPAATSYQAYIRLKQPAAPFNGYYKMDELQDKITGNQFASTLQTTKGTTHTLAIAPVKSASAENILAIHLVPVQHTAHHTGKIATSTHLVQPDSATIHPQIAAKALATSQNKYHLKTTIPDQISSGKNGYLIITTEKKRSDLTSLDAFIRHKQSRGFDVTVITEKDFGGGIGEEAALNIRKWLQQNYQSKNTLYCLMLGNPHPTEGDVPYKKVGFKKVETAFGFSKEKTEGLYPTDYFYVDLDCDWDKSKNGNFADEDDYGRGGINGQPEIYVGRIPYYGADSAAGNARDVDAALERVIRYENQAGSKSWRHNLLYAGDPQDRLEKFYTDILQHNGAKLSVHSSSATQPFLADSQTVSETNTLEALNSDKYGFIFYQGSGAPSASTFLTTKGAAKLAAAQPAVYALEGCTAATPETPANLANALLGHNAIAIYAATRDAGEYTGNPEAQHTSFYTPLHFGMSTGEALWSTRANQSSGTQIGAANFLVNLLGDPSIVPMPQLTGPALSLSPGFNARLSTDNADSAVLYEICNNSSIEETYTIKAVAELLLSETSFTLQPGESKQLRASIRPEITLNNGENKFTFQITSSTHKKQRQIIITK